MPAAGPPLPVAPIAAVALRTVAGTVQVDHMDAAGAECEVLLEHLARVGRVDRLGVEATLQQPDTAAAADVDGRNEQHQVSLRKLASTRLPTPADRSGWNCTPWKFSCLTAAENSPP